MKRFILTLAATVLLAGHSHADIIANSAGTIAGTSITWTVTTNSGPTPTHSVAGTTLDGGNNSSTTDNKITIDFSAPVDFTITNHLTAVSAMFSNESPAADVMADAGTWTFTDGLATGLAGTDPNFTLNGSSFTASLLPNGVDGTHNGGEITASDAWGQFDISGVTQVMYTAKAGSFVEAIRFEANATAVPEPSSVSLIALGMMGLLYRRKR